MYEYQLNQVIAAFASWPFPIHHSRLGRRLCGYLERQRTTDPEELTADPASSPASHPTPRSLSEMLGLGMGQSTLNYWHGALSLRM